MTTPSSPVGALPESSALAEASAESISELMSRDPEGYTKQDRARIIAAYRAQRERFQLAEQEKATAPKTPKAPKASALALASKSSADDLGF